MSAVSEDQQQKLQQLQMMEQSLQGFISQKQQFQAQLMEIESALGELKKTDNAYKIVGNIMLSAKKEDLEKDLSEKQDTTAIRIKTIEKQEAKLREKLSSLQAEVLEEMSKK